MAQTVRFAVVGVMGYAQTHLAHVHMLAQEGQGRLVASMMIDKADHPDLVAEFEARGVQVFDRYEDMLVACRDRVDVVTLPVPIHLHAPMSIAALEAGYHVWVEKPATGCLVEVDQMIAARDASGKQCAVGFQQIYSPVFQGLKERIVAGKLGQVRRIRMMALWPRTPAYYERNNWAGKLTCDGKPVYDSPFNNALAHQVMNMLYLASPEPRRAACALQTEAELFRAYDIESFDTGCMRVRTEGDVELFFAASHACDVSVDPVLKLEAQKATVNHRYGGDAIITYADGRTEIVEQGEPRRHMLNDIIAVVTGAVNEPLCTLEIARAQVACIEAIHRVAPIVPLPAELVSETREGQRAIAGIEKAVRSCFASGQLFSEKGALRSIP
jgi:predicted dehydrogenase